MDDFIYPRPRSIRPKIVLAHPVRFVIFEWQNDLYWTGENDWGKESEARIYSSLHSALESVRLLKQWLRWPPPESLN
jgi:hypothetical protein